MIQSLDLTKASLHSLPRHSGDVHYLKEVKEWFSNSILIGDKGYIGRHPIGSAVKKQSERPKACYVDFEEGEKNN